MAATRGVVTMALENGLERTGRARAHINNLQSRRDYLVERGDEKRAEGTPTFWIDREVEALDWVLPVLEAEWDNLCRMQKEVRRIEGRDNTAERNGTDPAKMKPVEWAT